MSTENTLTVVGIVVTIILGYLRLKYVSLNRRNTEIIFLKNASISLFKTIVKNLDDLEIRFKGNKINENLILFKGTFFNSGNVDIEKSVVHKPLQIELPSGYSWVSYKLIDRSEGLSVSAEVGGDKLIFEWDLLKEGEYFTFDGLIEYKSSLDDDARSDIGKNLVRNIKINHRITDLKKINKENSIPRPMPFGALIFLSLLILGFVIGLLYISLGQFFFPKYQVLNELKLDNATQYVTLKAVDQNAIIVKNDEDEDIGTFDKKELQSRLTGTIEITKESINYVTLIFAGLIAILYFILWVSLVVSEFRGRRLYGKLKSVADKYDEIDFENRRSVGFKFFEFRVR